MVEETIFQHEFLTNFAYPFFLIFFIVFAILEKTKLFGEGKKQINALISFVIGLIFLAAVEPKLIVGNLVLFLTLAIVIMFIGLLLWGFISGDALHENILKKDYLKWIFGIVIVIAVVIAVIWAADLDSSVLDFFFDQSWSGTFWTNAAFIVVIGIALALALRKTD